MDGWVIFFNFLFYLAGGFVVHVVICGDGSCIGVLFLGCELERGIYVGFNLGNTALSPFSVLYLGMRYICLLCTLHLVPIYILCRRYSGTIPASTYHVSIQISTDASMVRCASRSGTDLAYLYTEGSTDTRLSA